MTRTLALFALVAAAVLPVLAEPALASGDGQIEINAGAGWTHDVAAPLFSVDNVAPGWQQSRSFEVRNGGPTPADISLQSNDIAERENGCIHGEAQVDSTCGESQGELGHEMTFSIYTDPRNDGGFGAVPVWTGTLYDLEQPVMFRPALGAGATMGVRVVAAVATRVGDDIETDQVGFGLRIDAQQASTEVLGERTRRHDAGSSDTLAGATLPTQGGLPFTGLDVRGIGAAGIVLTVGGALLTAIARRRRTEANRRP